MNTNDPQAPYGGPDQQRTVGEMKAEMIEAFDRLNAELNEAIDKPTEREPMLSDGVMFADIEEGCDPMSGDAVRDFYESKITSGELRVVKNGDIVCISNGWTTQVEFGSKRFATSKHYCRTCSLKFDCEGPVDAKLCPGCGAQIVKA